ncbi:MAG TPA: nucleotide exchange factor GrpE [Saprospiraceae bacterium]|nr:nucleotide exchange factor GrpE [Saprospiraceae bacterium]
MDSWDMEEKDLQAQTENTPEDQMNSEELESAVKDQGSGPEDSTETGNQTEEEMKKLKKEHQELKDKYLRLYAEFDNFKKRTIKEKLDLMKTASSDTIQALLPVLDDFDRAKKNADDENTEESFSEGVSLVYQKLYAALQAKGLKPMETNDQPFDPELHEAVTEIPAPHDDMKGKIIDTIERGYFLNDKIIRHAKVVVGK